MRSSRTSPPRPPWRAARWTSWWWEPTGSPRNGDTANKIGTYGVAVLARHHGIPFYVAAPFSTIDIGSPTGRPFPSRSGTPARSRSWPAGASRRLTSPARNPAFDVTPAALITAIVTERGIYRPPYHFGGRRCSPRSRSMKKYHLLAPGPTPIPPEVLQAIAQPILHHRTPEFEALFGRVRTGLAELIGTRSEVLILAASGTGALEAAVVNLCSPGRRGAGRPVRQVRRALDGIARAFGVTVAHARCAVRRDRAARARRGGAPDPSPGARPLRDPERDVDRRARRRRGLCRAHPADRHAVRGRYRLVARCRAVPHGCLGDRRVVAGSQKGLMCPPGLAFVAHERPRVARGRAGPVPPLLLGSAHRARLASEEPGPVHARRVAPGGAGRRAGAARAEGLAEVYPRHDRLARAARAGPTRSASPSSPGQRRARP